MKENLLIWFTPTGTSYQLIHQLPAIEFRFFLALIASPPIVILESVVEKIYVFAKRGIRSCEYNCNILSSTLGAGNERHLDEPKRTSKVAVSFNAETPPFSYAGNT